MRRTAWAAATKIAGRLRYLAVEADRLMGDVEYQCWRRSQGMPRPSPVPPRLPPVPHHHHHTHMAR